MSAPAGRERCFLFLQGPLSPFYSEIGAQLKLRGHKVLRVNYCGNDLADWHHPGAHNFRDKPERWQPYLEELIAKEGVTDIVLHGDRRYYHAVAGQVAGACGVNVAATELGYLRPDWITIERGACSALSHFPNDPDSIREIASHYDSPLPGVEFPGSGWRLIAQELRFTLLNALLWPVFPHYRNHRRESRTEVYSGWMKARLTETARMRRSNAEIAKFRSLDAPYFLVALQLSGDFQIRDHSPFKDTHEAIRYIARSFSRHAPNNHLLVLKTHPLEYRYTSVQRTTEAVVDEFDLQDRVFRIDAGNLGKLSADAQGFITVNSTAGIEALASGCPTISIMPTIYDIEGLTFQGPLDAFWREGTKPDQELFEDLRRALAGSIQVRGSIYNPEGRKAAARSIAERLANGTLNANGAFVSEPPRLAKAARMGVTYPADKL